jgi:hypothetical protein
MSHTGWRLRRVQSRDLKCVRTVVENEHVAVVGQTVLLAARPIGIPAVKAKGFEDVVGRPLILSVQVAHVEQIL